jgi:calcineurin-like phosphoesterase
VVSLLGQIVGRDAAKPVDNPLHVIDAILDKEKDTPKIATVSISTAISAARSLSSADTSMAGLAWSSATTGMYRRQMPWCCQGGTAHITDVGMCGRSTPASV